MNNKVLLNSGGMDSYLLAHEPELEGALHLFVDVGQRYAKKELKAATFIAEKCGANLQQVFATNLAQFEHIPTGIIPFRNAEMILCAAQYADQIYLGVIADEVNSDKSEEFLRLMEAVMNVSHKKQYWTEGRRFSLHTPFRNTSKTELVRRYLRRGGSMEDLLQSVSCYSQSDIHCGQCSSCFKRWVALTCATGKDWSSRFAVSPALWKSREEWREKLASYPKDRFDDVMRALALASNWPN